MWRGDISTIVISVVVGVILGAIGVAVALVPRISALIRSHARSSRMKLDVAMLIASVSVATSCGDRPADRIVPEELDSTSVRSEAVPSPQTIAYITARNALPLAQTAAEEWDPESILLEVDAMGWIEVEGNAAFAHAAAPGPPLPPENIAGEDASNTPPLVQSWTFLFRSGNRYAAFAVDSNGVHPTSVTVPPGDALLPLSRSWIDSDSAFAIAIAAGASRLLGPPRLRMWNVNGRHLPLWIVPYVMEDGRVFLIRSDSVEILVRTDAEDSTKMVPYRRSEAEP